MVVVHVYLNWLPGRGFGILKIEGKSDSVSPDERFRLCLASNAVGLFLLSDTDDGFLLQ